MDPVFIPTKAVDPHNTGVALDFTMAQCQRRLLYTVMPARMCIYRRVAEGEARTPQCTMTIDACIPHSLGWSRTCMNVFGAAAHMHTGGTPYADGWGCTSHRRCIFIPPPRLLTIRCSVVAGQLRRIRCLTRGPAHCRPLQVCGHTCCVQSSSCPMHKRVQCAVCTVQSVRCIRCAVRCAACVQ